MHSKIYVCVGLAAELSTYAMSSHDRLEAQGMHELLSESSGKGKFEDVYHTLTPTYISAPTFTYVIRNVARTVHKL